MSEGKPNERMTLGALDIRAGWLDCCSPHAIRYPHGEDGENANEGSNEGSAFERAYHSAHFFLCGGSATGSAIASRFALSNSICCGVRPSITVDCGLAMELVVSTVAVG